MARIFISYRRKDASADAGRIYDRLSRRFGAASVTFDVDSIPPGIDFRDYIRRELDSCDCLLVVIGDRWLELLNHDSRHTAVTDWARFEIETALQRGIPVVPVLVGNASLAAADELPESISDLSYRNAIEVRSDGSFDGQMARLIEGIEQTASKPPKPTTAGRRPLKNRLTIAVVVVFGLAIAWQWKSIRREVFKVGTNPTISAIEAVDAAGEAAAEAVEKASDDNSKTLNALSVRTLPGEQVTAPGKIAKINVAVRGVNSQPLENARVTVSAGGGRFLRSATERFDPESRLHEPYSVVGKTSSQGTYTAFWVCNPCAPGYRLSIKVASTGYEDYSGNVTISVDSSRPQPPGIL